MLGVALDQITCLQVTRQVTPVVSGNQDLASGLVLAIEHSNRQAPLCCCHAGHHAGSTSTNDQEVAIK